jgi:hypothetical protein
LDCRSFAYLRNIILQGYFEMYSVHLGLLIFLAHLSVELVRLVEWASCRI